MSKIPPLNALRVFEVAARHGSFTKAANELNVTQSAVSKQVATLERHMGQQLFLRDHKTLHLTDAGKICARAMREALAVLEQSLPTPANTSTRRITVLTDVDFARLWLFPRLKTFEALYPDVLISLITKNFTQPIGRDEKFDLAVSWGQGQWDGFAAQPLFTNEVFPVCAPDFFAGQRPNIRNVLPHQLIHDRDTLWWKRFLKHLNAEGLDPESGRLFSQTGLCLDAAQRGDGIAIGDEVTTRAYLESGALILPFPMRMQSPDAYYLLAPSEKGFTDTHVLGLRDWLVKEATTHRSWAAGYWRRINVKSVRY